MYVYNAGILINSCTSTESSRFILSMFDVQIRRDQRDLSLHKKKKLEGIPTVFLLQRRGPRGPSLQQLT